MPAFRHGVAALTALVLFVAVAVSSAGAAQIKDICEVQGARGNMLKGIGLVVGLAGTGDQTAAAISAQERMLDRLEIDVASARGLKSDNCAVVIVTAVFPPFAKEGTRIDVQVSSLYDCESLEGGTLLDTHLKGADNNVYAVAQGPLSIGGFNVSVGGGTGVQINHVTAGRIPMGAYVEREIPSTITDGQRITLLLKKPDFTTAHNIQEAINGFLSEDGAAALGAGAINVKIPANAQRDLVGFIADLQQLDVQTSTLARVVVNERTGTIVIGGDVIIKPCQVAHGSLSIEIATTPIVSQPLPFSPGPGRGPYPGPARGTGPEGARTVVTEIAEVEAAEMEAYFMPVEGTSASDVAMALNKLKVTPRDMIAIFQALREAGALEADLEIM